MIRDDLTFESGIFSEAHFHSVEIVQDNDDDVALDIDVVQYDADVVQDDADVVLDDVVVQDDDTTAHNAAAASGTVDDCQVHLVVLVVDKEIDQSCRS